MVTFKKKFTNHKTVSDHRFETLVNQNKYLVGMVEKMMRLVEDLRDGFANINIDAYERQVEGSTIFPLETLEAMQDYIKDDPDHRALCNW